MKIFLIVFCVGFSCYYMLANIFHTPKTPLTEDIKKKILCNGLMHFTSETNAQKILIDGLIPQKHRALFRSEEDMVWMYIYEPDYKNRIKLGKYVKDKKRSYVNTCVHLINPTEEDLQKLRHRKSDNAIASIGPFKTEHMTYEVMEL